MTTTFSIRPAAGSDLSAISNYDLHISAERLADSIRRGFVLVPVLNKTVAGVVRWQLFWQTIPFLDLIYLDSSCRGVGLGRSYMRFLEDELKRQGNRHLMTSTQVDETAKFFYERLGYLQIGSFFPPEQEAEELIYLKSF